MRRDGARLAIVLLPVLPLPLVRSSTAVAQGITTAGIRGTVTTAGQRTSGVRIRASREATGFAVEVAAREGRFLIEGLEPGGPYTITARGIGFSAQRQTGVMLALGELREVAFELHPVPVHLDTVSTTALGRRSPGGGMSIDGGLLEHLPTLNRDVYDFVRLVPQISTRISLANPGMSAAGVGFRFNDFLINGVSERTLIGGVSNAFAGARSIPLDAVQEYQVLVAPYDVRYGDFAGALVNTVTKSGTNTLSGSTFAFARNDRLARSGSAESATGYERLQYGLSVGGPLVRDRLHFFVAPELQQFSAPAAGPYAGQPESAERPMAVSPSALARFDSIMSGYGLSPGSASLVTNRSPLRNLYSRLDLALPRWKSRAVLWHNFSGSEEANFSRAARDTFSLSSYQFSRESQLRTTALHLHSTLPRGGGGHNELIVAHRSDAFVPTALVQQPIVRVSVPVASGGRTTLNSGTHEAAQAIEVRTSALVLKDNLTVPLGSAHVVTVGADVEHFQLRRSGTMGSFGAWSFASLEALALGVADRYDVRIELGNSGQRLGGNQYAAYLSDRWQPSSRLALTGGLRGDMLAIGDQRAPYQWLVDSLFGRRTDEMPRQRVELSPRIGFQWDLSANGRQQLRGGAGIFSGRYPLAWSQTALSSYGAGGVLRCSRAGPTLPVPPSFVPDRRSPPTSCATGAGITAATPGDVDLLSRDLRMMRVARGSIAYDRRLAGDVQFTTEAMLTRALSDFVFVNLNLAAPMATDANGRVMYGSVSPSGVATAAQRSPFSEVIELRSGSHSRSFQLSTRLARGTDAGARGMVSYTFSRVRDAQTPVRVNTRGAVAWASARATSGRHDDLTAGISANDLPHRVVAAGSWVLPWSGSRTELSFSYLGEVGRPFTYLAFGALGRGDLNADGSNANDPVYIPRTAGDTLEIRFSGTSTLPGADNSTSAQLERERAQQVAFDALIERTPCLARQRGRIMERNSCREPWSNATMASVRHVVSVVRRAVEVQLDIHNVLNALNAGWGVRREAAPALLEHVGQSGAGSQAGQPVFRYAVNDPQWTTLAFESAFQLQLGVRYRF